MICGALPVPANGSKEVSRSNVGGVASFTCDEGYTLQGERKLVCQVNGQWNGEVPTCAADLSGLKPLCVLDKKMIRVEGRKTTS